MLNNIIALPIFPDSSLAWIGREGVIVILESRFSVGTLGISFSCQNLSSCEQNPGSDQEIDFILDQLTSEQRDEFNAVDWDSLRGKIIGETTIQGQLGIGHIRMAPASPWFFGKFGFVVQDGVLYEKAIPYKGQLGLFKTEMLGDY